jgi:hypothetical protein
MHTLTCQGIQKSREHSYQRLSFSSPHFSDLTLVQHHSSCNPKNTTLAIFL